MPHYDVEIVRFLRLRSLVRVTAADEPGAKHAAERLLREHSLGPVEAMPVFPIGAPKPELVRGAPWVVTVDDAVAGRTFGKRSSGPLLATKEAAR